jgi:hypothetical protein
MSLVGTPGSGKSFILKKIANMFSPVIFHRELGKWQIPFLFIEMPYDGSSVYTLATQIFLALDRLMPDSGYFRTYVDTKSINAERLCMKALNIAYEMGVGMIVVDEAQNSRSIGNHLLPHRKPSAVAATRTAESGLKKLLITASNVGHMPLMFTGTMELEATTAERASVARRKAGRGSATWKPLTNVVVPAAGISEFDLFMKVLFEMQWLAQPVTYDEKWPKLFFERTQGVPDLMVKLFQSTQVAAIRADSQSLEPRHLEIAFEEFRSAEATLNGLANRDEASLLNLTDLFGLAPPELAQPTSAFPLPQPRTSAMNQKAVELKNLIDKNFTVKDKKAPQHVKPGPIPIRVPPEARDALTQADLRSVTPIAESPLNPIPR